MLLDPDPHAPLALAEHILELLDQGRFTATYKYAVLLALLDLCLENAARDGAAPDLLTTRQLAVKIVELYWPHTRPWATGALRQSSGPGGGQAEIVAAIERFRAAAASDGSTPLAEALARAPARYQRLLDFVEWKLIEMPLPRLQTIGDESVTFLYAINWTQSVRQPDVGRYQRGEGGPFDNRIHLPPGVGEALVRLNHLLRPLIHHQWAVKVATLNRLDEYQLERFLFGAERVPLERVRGPIIELQEGRCFYGDTARRRRPASVAEVDCEGVADPRHRLGCCLCDEVLEPRLAHLADPWDDRVRGLHPRQFDTEPQRPYLGSTARERDDDHRVEPFVLDGIRNDDSGMDLPELGRTRWLQVDPVGASALHWRLRLAGRARSAFVHSSSQARSSGVSRRNAA